MKQIPYLSSMIALTAIIGSGVSVPVNAGEQTVEAQTSRDQDMVRRSGCHRPAQ